MKTNFLLKKQALSILLSLSTIAVFSQSQKHVWYLKNQEIDFSTTTPTVSPISPSFGAGGDDIQQESGNGIHNSNGDKILSVFNQTVYSQYGPIGTLDHFERAVSPPLFIPKPGSPCSYYIVYSSRDPFVQNPSNPPNYCTSMTGSSSQYNKFYAEVDLSANSGSGEIVSNGNGIELDACNHFAPNPIAVSKELQNGNRYLYLLGFDAVINNQTTSRILKYEVTSSGINLTYNSNKHSI